MRRRLLDTLFRQANRFDVAASTRSWSAEAASTSRPTADPMRELSSLRTWAAFLVIPTIGCAGLGYWQLQRKEWKEEQLVLRRDMLTQEPVGLYDLPDEPVEYTHIKARGKYDHGKSMFVGPRIKHIAGRAMPGYHLIVPFKSDEGKATVLVNRGWVPKAYKDFVEVRKKYEHDKTVDIEAFVAKYEKGPTMLEPQDKTDPLQWLWTDQDRMLSYLNLPRDTPFLAVMDPPREDLPTDPKDVFEAMRQRESVPKVDLEAIPFPLGKTFEEMMRFSLMPQDHLGYAATWFGISAVAAFGSVRAMRRARALQSMRMGDTKPPL